MVTDPGELYGLPLERFVAERGALSKQLRSEGRRDEAERVAAMRKPSLAVWAVNQLVRTQPRAISTLFQAGDALQRAHAAVLAGEGDANALRDASERERAAIDELVQLASGLLDSDGHGLSAAILDRVSATLHAAALNSDARTLVQDGRLERELHHVGLGSAAGTEVPDAGPRSSSPARADKRAVPDNQAAKRAARQQAEQLKPARKAETQARRDAALAERELQRAVERRDRAADRLRDAEQGLGTAREVAEQAALAHRRAQDALERAGPKT